MSRSTPTSAACLNGSDQANSTRSLAKSRDDASGLLQTLQGHVDDIRTLLQCGICIRPLYEPFTLACGHTFCYSCLTSWFGGGRSNRTCPDCRAPVKQQPAPAYLVRAVVQMFTSRAELLDKGETTADHTRHQHEEAEKIENDKRNTNPKEGGLFRGTFNKIRLPVQAPIVDLEDGVVRCPRCSWELEEDSGCAQCGYRQDDMSETDASESGVDPWSDSDENSEMTDYLDDELEDGFGEVDNFNFYGRNGVPVDFPIESLPFDLHNQLYGLHRQLQHHHNHHNHLNHLPFLFNGLNGGSHSVDSYPGDSVTHDSEEEEDSEDADMDSFIDDEEHDYDSESDRSTVVGDPDLSTRDHHDDSQLGTDTPVSHTEDDISDDLEEISESEEEEEEDDDDDDEPVRPPLNGIRRRQITTYHEILSSPAQSNGLTSRRYPYPTRPSEISRNQPTAAGSSAFNAINVEDDSDEGPVGPSRRSRERRNWRPAPF